MILNIVFINLFIVDGKPFEKFIVLVVQGRAQLLA